MVGDIQDSKSKVDPVFNVRWRSRKTFLPITKCRSSWVYRASNVTINMKNHFKTQTTKYVSGSWLICDSWYSDNRAIGWLVIFTFSEMDKVSSIWICPLFRWNYGLERLQNYVGVSDRKSYCEPSALAETYPHSAICHVLHINKWGKIQINISLNLSLPVEPGHHNTGLFICPSGISELDCATIKTDTAERSISIGRESLQVFFVLGVLAYFQVPPLGSSRDKKWR